MRQPRLENLSWEALHEGRRYTRELLPQLLNAHRAAASKTTFEPLC
jgi:hypothetical protein